MIYFNNIEHLLCEVYTTINWLDDKNVDDEGNVLSKFVLPKNKHKRFRSILGEFYYEHMSEIPDEILAKLSADTNEQEIIDFLHENYLKTQTNKEKARIENLAVCLEFSEETCSLLMSIDEWWMEYWDDNSNLKVDKSGRCFFVSKESYAYKEFLVFENATIPSDEEWGYVTAFEYSKKQDTYMLEMVIEDERIVSIEFQSVHLEREFYNYSSMGIQGSLSKDNCQWIIVANLLNELSELETNFGKDRMNEKEKALLPLTHFAPIMMFTVWSDFTLQDEESIILFERYAKENHATHVFPLLEKFKNCGSEKEIKKVAGKLNKLLCDKSCELLWRQLYHDLKEAASEYPDKISVNQDEAAAMRENITAALLSQGFEGAYPHFKKRGRLKGIKILENQMNTYFVGNEKNMVSYIYCEENNRFGDRLSVAFLCGTMFLKKDELQFYNTFDVYSAFFLDKGRRFATVVYPGLPDWIDDKAVYVPEEEVAIVAAKKAMLQKITKEEKSKTLAIEPNLLVIFIAFGLFGSLLFGLCMTIGFALITLVLGLIFTLSLQTTWQAILHAPWHWVFLGSGLPFGFIMAMITVVTAKKR